MGSTKRLKGLIALLIVLTGGAELHTHDGKWILGGHVLSAISPERTFLRAVVGRRDNAGFGALQDALGICNTISYSGVILGNLIGIVEIGEETVEVDRVGKAVVLIKGEKVGSGDFDTALLQHPALIGDIEGVDEFVLPVLRLIF